MTECKNTLEEDKVTYWLNSMLNDKQKYWFEKM